MAVKAKLREERDKRKVPSSAEVATAHGAGPTPATADAAHAAPATAEGDGIAVAGAPAGSKAADAGPANAAADGAMAAEGGDADPTPSLLAPALSPFACISATMGYGTFHMLQTLWLGVIDLPTNSSEKDWDLQVRRRTRCRRCVHAAYGCGPLLTAAVFCWECSRITLPVL